MDVLTYFLICNLTLVVIAPGCAAFVGVDLPSESLPLYVVVSTVTSGCTTMLCMEDWTDCPELCQLGGSSVMVVREGALGRGADLPARLLSPPLVELDLRGWMGELFGDGVERRSGCSSGLTWREHFVV